jgi:hypothetical protein
MGCDRGTHGRVHCAGQIVVDTNIKKVQHPTLGIIQTLSPGAGDAHARADTRSAR